MPWVSMFICPDKIAALAAGACEREPNNYFHIHNHRVVVHEPLFRSNGKEHQQILAAHISPNHVQFATRNLTRGKRCSQIGGTPVAVRGSIGASTCNEEIISQND